MSGYTTACAILRATPAALEKRLRAPEAAPWQALADMRNAESEARLQAAAHLARQKPFDGFPLLTQAGIVRAAILKLESIMAAVKPVEAHHG